MNPFDMLDNILADWASPRARRLIHGIIALALLVITGLFAADGDWKTALGTLAVTAYAAMNKANTHPQTQLESGSPEENFDDGSPLYGQTPPLYQPGSDEDGFGGDAPVPFNDDPLP